VFQYKIRIGEIKENVSSGFNFYVELRTVLTVTLHDNLQLFAARESSHPNVRVCVVSFPLNCSALARLAGNYRL